MFILGNILSAFAAVLQKVLELYSLVVVIAVLVQWVRPDPFNPIVQFLRAVTEPAFERVRRYLPFTVVGFLDLAPMVVLLVIWFLQLALIPSLYDVATRMR